MQYYKRIMRVIWPAVMTAAIIGIIVLANPRHIAEVNGVRIYEEEMLVYLRLTAIEYEEIAGENIWEASLDGRDPLQTAAENALESALEVKLLQPREYSFSAEESADLQVQYEKLVQILGDDWIRRNGIDEDTLKQVLRENYLAKVYQDALFYDTDGIENEIEEHVETAFDEYNEIDQSQYLQKAKFEYIMCYTGEWIDGVWVAYPQKQQSGKMALAEYIDRRLESGVDFLWLKEQYAPEEMESNPLFFEGIMAEYGGEDGYFYRGQIREEAARMIFSTPPDETSQVLETEYGYLLVYVKEIREAAEQDFAIFQQALTKAKEAYRAELVETLRQEKIREEIALLRDEASVEIRYTELDQILSRYVEEEIHG